MGSQLSKEEKPAIDVLNKNLLNKLKSEMELDFTQVLTKKYPNKAFNSTILAQTHSKEPFDETEN